MTARIDRLAPEQKQTLQKASVLGRVSRNESCGICMSQHRKAVLSTCSSNCNGANLCKHSSSRHSKPVLSKMETTF